MWKRKELKSKAKKVVHKNYWTFIVVCFLIALFTGEFGSSILGIWTGEDSMDPNYVVHREEKIEYPQIEESLNETQRKLIETVELNLNDILKSQKYAFKIWDAINYFVINRPDLGIILCITAIISFAFTIFIAHPLIVGGKKYFLKAREGETAKVGILGEVFSKENWLSISKIMFLRNIYNALWYLTIVGGIIKTYEYRMIPYILAENPQIERKEAFRISKEMMKNNKWKTFVLDLSFFGWHFLSVITFGLLGILYVNPYNAATMAELYVELKNNIK